MKQSNKKFNRAKKLKNDEWRTYIVDITKELRAISFWGDTVLCCCNDYDSAFKDYFVNLMANYTNFKTPPIVKAIFTEYNPNGNAKVLEVNSELKTTKKILKGKGDFASEEVIALIKEATIIVTNPPFSKFREFVELLIKYDKKFVIIGPKNACAYRWYFKLWKEWEIDYGDTVDDNFWFQNKEGEWTKFRNIAWHTHLVAGLDKEKFLRGPNYVKESYPLLENYPAIYVDKVDNIPIDYKGLMAVPPSFGYRLNKDQFEIVDIIEPIIKGKRKYTKIIIRNLG